MIAIFVGLAASMSSAATPPVLLTPPEGLVTTDDYPRSALIAEIEGATTFLLAVDEKGVIADCMTARSSGSPVLDDVTCALVKMRARFAPARNALGKPAKGTYSRTIRWQIPHDDSKAVVAQALRPADLTVQFDVAADGSVSRCTALATGAAMAPPEICQGFSQTLFDKQPDGKAAVRHVTFQTLYKIEER